ncbi:MAG: TrmH family RNA methyltransferase [Candidatus Wildermuthbacteria bacterium]|nr:TrmH family RNA methyltransferase [Candidatus Wildermuthbacteria bacterium]
MEKEFFVIVDNVRSLENVGSIFRTADAFGATKIFLCGITGIPHGKGDKISKTALGAEQWIPWEYHKQTWRVVEKMKRARVFIAALEQTSKSVPLDKFIPRFPLALVVGNEVEGVSSSVLERADACVEIPMSGKKESLNVAVAFGIAAHAIARYRN